MMTALQCQATIKVHDKMHVSYVHDCFVIDTTESISLCIYHSDAVIISFNYAWSG